MTSTDRQTASTVEDVYDLDDHDDESWLATTTPNGFRVRTPVAALGLGIAITLGMWAGATLESSQSTTASAATGNPAGGGRGAAGGTNAGATTAAGAQGASSARGGLTGTVASVQGSQIQLTTSTGSTVTVTLLPSTTIARTASAAPSDITAGETITVRGQTGADGNTTAQALTIVPAGTAGG
jgi:hypothetical protein